MRIALDWMYDIFEDAPVLGSLLNPKKVIECVNLSHVLEEALVLELSEEKHEAAVVVPTSTSSLAGHLPTPHHSGVELVRMGG